MPTVFAAANECTPSMLARKLNTGGAVSFQLSTCGVGASLPVPSIGQMGSPVIGKGAAPLSLSALKIPETMLGEQLVLCQSGELSLRTPKFEPPTISR